MRWMVRTLDQTQEFVLKEVLEHCGISWVNGFAGSGKSIVAVHLCKRFRDLKPSANIALITFTHALKEMLQVGIDSLSAKEIVVTTHTDLMRTGVHYDIIVLDEVQDIPLVDIRRIRAMCSRLILFGDVDQSIYMDGVSVADLKREVQLKELRLSRIFRLTEKVQQAALYVCPKAGVIAGDNAGNRAEAEIKRAKFTDGAEEANWVYEDACSRARADYPSGILLTTHKEIYCFAKFVARGAKLPVPPKRERMPKPYEAFNVFWKDQNHPLRYLGSGSGDLAESRNEPIVYLMTYHSAKGLDFQNVYLPRAVPRMNLNPSGKGDDALERRLMFVAVTRTRENLFITHTGAHAHRYIDKMPGMWEFEPRLRTGSEEEDNGVF